MNRKYQFVMLLLWLAACGQVNQAYFPLGNGLYRQYVIEQQVNSEKQVLKSIQTDLKPRVTEGITYYPRTHANGETLYFRQTTAGISVSSEPGKVGETVLGFPLQPGTSWQMETRIDILHRRHESFSGGESFINPDQKVVLDFQIASLDDQVEVPVGRFINCMRIEGRGGVKVEARTRGIDHILIEQTDWYARGIGLIKRIRTEKSVPAKYEGTLTQELEVVK